MPNPPKLYTVGSETRTLQEWSERHGVPVTTINSRLKLGWSVADAVSVKPDRRFRPTSKPTSGAVRPCPRMKEHKSTGRAHCEWQFANQRHVRYFGKWGSAEAQEAYKRFQLEWATRLVKNSPVPLGETLLVAELVEQWLAYCENGDDGEGGYQKHGKLTSEIHSQRAAMNYLLAAHGSTSVDEFGPEQLRAVRKAMIDARPLRNGKPSPHGLSRNTINGYQTRLVQMFGWGVGRKLVPATVWHELKAVGRLQKGKTVARDPAKKKAVPWVDVEATLPHLHTDPDCRAVLESLVRLHWLVGGRPEDLVSLRPGDLDRTGDVWSYSPETHKNEHREQELTYWIGPKAQAILAPLLAGKADTDFVFCYPGAAGGQPTPIRRAVYGNRVKAACKKAKVKPWTPHQLRHSRATEVMRIYESNAAAAAVIGDSEEVARTVYVDPLDAVRKRIARETG
ncbi:MAG TPA: site-specific integrase [Gemmata sp.]